MSIAFAAHKGDLKTVQKLMHDGADPSKNDSLSLRTAAEKGWVAVVRCLMQDSRVDPSAKDNFAIRRAAQKGYLAVIDQLREDPRVDLAVALPHLSPEQRRTLECRERMTEICIGLQELELPAWVTIKILKAACPRSTMPLHSKWSLACAVKHFHNKRSASD
jgi:hypothetical protein